MITLGIDHTLLLQILQFIVIVLVARFMIAGPARETMASRDAKINGLKKDAEDMKKLLESKRAEYEAKLAAVRHEMAELQKSTKEAATAAALEQMTALKADVDAKVAAARSEIAAETETARASLRDDAKQIADLVFAKLLGKSA